MKRLIFITTLLGSSAWAQHPSAMTEKQKLEMFQSLKKKSATNIAKTWNLDQLVKDAKPADLVKTLKDISVEPVKTTSKQQLFKVTRVATGSIYEKAGVKVGDFAIQ